MLSAIELTGGAAISLESLNAFAYFANVLSPLWEIEPVEGSVLKDGAPRFPLLEAELDRLVGEGLVVVDSLAIEASTEGSPMFKVVFKVNTAVAAPVLLIIQALPDEQSAAGFLVELAAAFLDIRFDRQDDAATKDAAYSNPKVSTGRVVDFAEWVSPTKGNASWNVAQSFQRYVPETVTLSRAEKLVMYMNLMKRRAHG